MFPQHQLDLHPFGCMGLAGQQVLGALVGPRRIEGVPYKVGGFEDEKDVGWGGAVQWSPGCDGEDERGVLRDESAI
jgi:hypothetical protein